RTGDPRDRLLLHVDQWRGESRAVPEHGARAGRGFHVCGRQRPVRRHGGIRRVVTQVVGPGGVVCLVRHCAGRRGVRSVVVAAGYKAEEPPRRDVAVRTLPRDPRYLITRSTGPAGTGLQVGERQWPRAGYYLIGPWFRLHVESFLV